MTPYSDEWFLDLPKVKEEHTQHLIQPVSISEVRWAIFCTKSQKSLGPDGAPVGFFKEFWENICTHVWETVNAFSIGGHILRDMNRKFIVLIPKVSQSTQVTQYRPISLCNTMYKIITKIMVNRMKIVLLHLISEH